MRAAISVVRVAGAALLFSGLLVLCACEPFFSHETLTRVFNGVPQLPDQEALCRNYDETKARRQDGKGQQTREDRHKEEGSKHPPYAEKRCNSCHAADGEVSNSLVKPKNELCFLCHKGILKGAHRHGPASEGDCLSCHEPHESANPFLLNKPRAKLCDQCHEEQRQAAAMHSRLAQHQIACPDCHDPHSGANRYFLK